MSVKADRRTLMKWTPRHQKCFSYSLFFTTDFSILRLEYQAQLSSKVDYICLPSTSSYVEFSGIELTISGWGRTKEDGSLSNVLKFAKVIGISNEDCKRTYGNDKITNKMLCAYKVSNFINIQQAAFTRTGPESTKKTVKLSVFFALA